MRCLPGTAAYLLAYDGLDNRLYIGQVGTRQQ
jgi:hypothetical protein